MLPDWTKPFIDAIEKTDAQVKFDVNGMLSEAGYLVEFDTANKVDNALCNAGFKAEALLPEGCDDGTEVFYYDANNKSRGLKIVVYEHDDDYYLHWFGC